MTNDTRVQAAAAPYTTGFLKVYDLWVVRVSNSVGWRCDSQNMLDMYNEHLSSRHLEVGPGSGWYLSAATFPIDRPEITLLDLSSSAMEFTARRLGSKAAVTTVTGSILDPVPSIAGSGFGSIGINYVLHCVPGDWHEKGIAFAHLAQVLADDGVLFGSTILGRNQPRKNLFGSALMWTYNRVGAFNNRADDRAGLQSALDAAFEDVELFDIGDVTLFTARGPRR